MLIIAGRWCGIGALGCGGGGGGGGSCAHLRLVEARSTTGSNCGSRHAAAIRQLWRSAAVHLAVFDFIDASLASVWKVPIPPTAGA